MIERDPVALNLPVQEDAGAVSRIEALMRTVKGIWIEPDAP